MTEIGEDKIDELFRTGLRESEIPFEEAHWRDMKKKLEGSEHRRRDIFVWASLGGAAAMFLMALTWWAIQPRSIETNKIVKGTPDNIKIEQNRNTGSDKAEQAEAIITQKEANVSFNQSSFVTTKNIISLQPLQKDESISNKKPEEVAAVNSNPGRENTTVSGTNLNVPDASVSGALPAENTALVLQNDKGDVKKDSSRIVADAKTGFKPSFVLSITAASDLSSVNSFTNIKNGFNGGILATVSFSPKLSVTTGAVLARKVYETGFTNYKPNSSYIFPVSPLSVYADCRVLDVPLNLNYLVFDKGNNKIRFSAGASSYFMITEKYNFRYQDPAARGPRRYSVRNENKHYMGVGNIAVSYERQLNKNAGISIQPFAKLPLTEIGYGNVKLLSGGVSVNLNINVSEITGKKP